MHWTIGNIRKQKNLTHHLRYITKKTYYYIRIIILSTFSNIYPLKLMQIVLFSASSKIRREKIVCITIYLQIICIVHHGDHFNDATLQQVSVHNS